MNNRVMIIQVLHITSLYMLYKLLPKTEKIARRSLEHMPKEFTAIERKVFLEECSNQQGDQLKDDIRKRVDKACFVDSVAKKLCTLLACTALVNSLGIVSISVIHFAFYPESFNKMEYIIILSTLLTFALCALSLPIITWIWLTTSRERE